MGVLGLSSPTTKAYSRMVVTVSPSIQMIGVNWTIDKADNEEVRKALPVWLFDTNICIDQVAALPHRHRGHSVALFRR